MRTRPSRILRVVTSRVFVRSALLAFFAAACLQLVLFMRWTAGEGVYVPRPEAVAGLLPVGHFTSFFAWVRGGGWDTLLPAGLVIIVAAVAVSLLFKRGFCGWICPVGTVWELAALLGRKALGRTIRLPRWLDRTARGARYALAAAILAALMVVPLAEALSFRELPYMWTADMKILIGFTGAPFVLAALVAFALSMMFGPVWCRFLCPLGAWYGVLGMASPCAVHRSEAECIACHRCTDACHALVDVERAPGRVWGPECDGCMDCVRACPAPGALEARVLGRWRMPAWVWPMLVVGAWLLIFSAAKIGGNWDTTIPPADFKRAVESGVLGQSSMPQQR